MFSKKSKGATTFDEKSGVSAFLWMLLGAIIVIITGLIAYKSGKFTFLQGNKKTEEIKVIDASTVKLKKDSKEDKYEFYEILPEQEMSSISDEALISEIAQSDPTPEININEFKPDVIVTTDKNEEQQKASATNPTNVEDQATKTDIKTDNTTTTTNKTTEKQAKSEETDETKAKSKAKVVQGDDEIVIVYEEGTYDENDKKTAKPTEQKAKTVKKDTPVAQTTEKKQAISKVEKTDIQPIKEAPASNKKSYILQINSYDEANQADKRRAQVLMAGVDAKVIKKVNGDTIVYQVVSTAMNKPSEVLKSQRLLQKNGIDSLIIEQRHK